MRTAFLSVLLLTGCYPDEPAAALPRPVPSPGIEATEKIGSTPSSGTPVAAAPAPRGAVLLQPPGGTIQAGRHTFPEYLTLTITAGDADLVGQSVRLRWRLAEYIERWNLFGIRIPVAADGYYFWIGDASLRTNTINRFIITPGRTWEPAPVEPEFGCATCSIHMHPTTFAPLDGSRVEGQALIRSYNAAPFGFSGRMQGRFGVIDFTVR